MCSCNCLTKDLNRNKMSVKVQYASNLNRSQWYNVLYTVVIGSSQTVDKCIGCSVFRLLKELLTIHLMKVVINM